VVGAQLKTGEIDFGAIDPSTLVEMEKATNLVVNKYDTLSFVYYAYNLDKSKTELFQEKEVRQALLYGLDRKAMAEAILFGQGVAADSIYPLASWAYDPKDNPQYAYDPNKAKQMLDAAGWKAGADGVREKNGRKLAFTVYTNSGNKVRENFINVLQEQWKAIGVQATPKTEEFGALLNRFQKTKDFEIVLIGFSWNPDPDDSTMFSTKGQQGGFNTNSYSNPKVDELLDQGLKETNKDKRKAIYKQIDKQVLDDLPSPILVFQKNLLAVNKRVKGIEPNTFNLLYNVHTWTVS
jgi:peptide/nickel transport system substrate-binding protein